jgi:plasmid replication initiation protein
MYDTVIPADKSVVLSIQTKKLLQACPNFTVMYKALVSICKKTIELNSKERFFVGHIVNSAEHIKREPTIDVELNKEVLHLFLRQQDNFTTYNLLTALSFRSMYTQRFYELCSMNLVKGGFLITIDKLQELFGSRYKLTADFFRKVIIPAQKELYRAYKEGQIDFYFSWETAEKEIKKIIGLKFIVYKRERITTGNDEDLLSQEERANLVYNINWEIQYYLAAIMSLHEAKDKFSTVIDNIIRSKTPNAAAIAWYEKLERIKNTYKDRISIAKVLLHAIHQDTS